MNFESFFPKVGTWLESSHLFVQWCLEKVSIFLPDYKPAVKNPVIVLPLPLENYTIGAGDTILQFINQESRKFINYASALFATVVPWLVWMAPAISILMFLFSRIKEISNQGSWVASLAAIGDFFDRPIPTCEWADIFSRKSFNVFLTISFITSGTIIYFATDVWMVNVARMIAGSVIFTLGSIRLVDRDDWQVHTLISDYAMTICLGSLVYYFGLQEHSVAESSCNHLIPLISMGVYITTFAHGYGPILGLNSTKLRKFAIANEPYTTGAYLDAPEDPVLMQTVQDPSITFDQRLEELENIIHMLVADKLSNAVDKRFRKLEDAILSLPFANSPRRTAARLVALDDAVRSLSAQFAVFTANCATTNHPQEARTVDPSGWCYYHVRHGSNAQKCESDQCTFALTSMKNPSK